MTPDDPRHGFSSGYVAGCRQDCCRTARRRRTKRRNLRNLRGETAFVGVGEIELAAQPWRLMGFSDAAIQNAAGLSSHHPFRRGQHLRSTLDAVRGITDADFEPKAFVSADLTRYRIYSLMAAGHALRNMPINNTGRWRDRPRITVEQARTIRDYYRANEFKLGGSAITMSRARNAGHVPPLAWDDPDTLAWPDGRPAIRRALDHRRKTDVDPVVVQRVIGGDKLPMTTAERFAVVGQMRNNGWSFLRIEAQTGIQKPERYVEREAVA